MPRAPKPKHLQGKPFYRPEKLIDWDTVDKLLMAQCSGVMIAGYFDLHPDTFYDRVAKEKGVSFTVYSTSKKDRGKSMVMAKHFKRCMDESDRAIEKFGEQHLDWSKKINQTITSQLEISQKKPILELDDNGMQPITESVQSPGGSAEALL